MTYHLGELAVQQKAGVQKEAEDLVKIIGASIPPVALNFLRSQQLAIASTLERNGRVWASALTGKPGFVQVREQGIQINATQIAGDPFNKNLLFRNEIGMLLIDLTTRRRLRLNGKAQMQPDHSIYVHPQQVYFNCPKYIQMRHITPNIAISNNRHFEHSDILSESQQNWIAKADTFFIASFHPESGADASHRGGNSGFVKVLNSSKLIFPDYSGNNMFNTLGNITVNPRSGILFIDFEQGNTLQLTGKASIIWDKERLTEFAGAERLVEFQIEQVIATSDAILQRWKFGEYSPFNPA